MSLNVEKSSRWSKISSGIAVLMLVGAFGLSMVKIFTIRRELAPPGKKVLRLCHWQLELGYRAAMENLFRKYEALHPDVKFMQIPVTEKVYGQWLNTHLVGGTAPDLSEMGFSSMVGNDQYLVRYYVPLTEEIAKPNPYNKGTPLEKLPWRETFVDGMRTAYRPNLQEYYSVPENMHTVRVFYNKPMFRKILGHDTPPKTLGELLAICEKIKDYRKKTGVSLVPIAGSKYNSMQFLHRYNTPFTAWFEPILDVNLDGSISALETYVGLLRGQVSLHHPREVAHYQCLRDICRNFQGGFMSVYREQAAYLFVQGNAAMISTGSWDAMSLFRQAKFEVGLFDFPMPAPGEPYAKFVLGRGNEAGTGGASLYGITKQSRHIDIALDFLRFSTTAEMNEAFCRDVEWLPIVQGAKIPPRLIPFAPNPKGYNSSTNWRYGAVANQWYEGKLWGLLEGQIDYAEFADPVEATLRNPDYGGDKAWMRGYETAAGQVRFQERTIAILSSEMLFGETRRRATAAHKLNVALLKQARQDHSAEALKHLFRVVHGKEMPEL